MNYELAKELKEAGFEQKKASHLPHIDNEGPFCCVEGCNVYAPTLSELIEACGERFSQLVAPTKTIGKIWVASGFGWKEEGGSTPEEAVARLWLALNKLS